MESNSPLSERERLKNDPDNLAPLLAIEMLVLMLVEKNMLTVEEARTVFAAPLKRLQLETINADKEVDPERVSALEQTQSQLSFCLEMLNEYLGKDRT